MSGGPVLYYCTRQVKRGAECKEGCDSAGLQLVSMAQDV